MEYEELLGTAMEQVEYTEECSRFELLKVTGHHEGNRTVILNMGDIASCLRRPITHILKFLSKELAASSEMNGGKVFFSRRLSSKDINEKIEKYARRFVFCPSCKKPDTEVTTTGKSTIIRCLACGTKENIPTL